MTREGGGIGDDEFVAVGGCTLGELNGDADEDDGDAADVDEDVGEKDARMVVLLLLPLSLV